MTIIFEFIRNIAVYIVFVGIIGALIPNEKYRGYIDLLTGVILVLLLISPFTSLFRADFNDILADFGLQFDRRVIAGEFVHNNDTQNEIILAAFRNNLREQLARLILPFGGYSFADAEFIVGEGESDFGEIKEIRLVLTKAEAEQDRARFPIIRVEPVSVRPGTDQRLHSGADPKSVPVSDEIEKIKNAVSDFYNLPSSNIYITVQESR